MAVPDDELKIHEAYGTPGRTYNSKIFSYNFHTMPQGTCKSKGLQAVASGVPFC